MTYLKWGLRAVLVLLSLAAGVAKLMQTPAEMEFFASAGLGSVWLYPLGAVQVVGAALAVLRGPGNTGLALIGIGFAISSAVIFMTGNTAFGLISLVPLALTILAMRLGYPGTVRAQQ